MPDRKHWVGGGPVSSDINVLVVLNSLELGGTQLNAIDHAWALAGTGVRSSVVGFSNGLPAEGPTLLDAAAERGVSIELLGVQGPIVESASVIREAADRHEADIVHAYSNSQTRFAFWGPCRFGRRPLVMTIYEMEVTSLVSRRQHLIVGTRTLLEEQKVERPGPVYLISPPVDTARDSPTVSSTAFLSEHALDPAHTRIVIVSRLEEFMKAKAVEDAARAIALIDRPDSILVVVGSGGAESRLRAIGDQVNAILGRRAVVFTGSMSDPRAAYASADIVIGMGGSAARSLAFGKPLVVSGEFGWYRSFTPDTAAALYRDSFWSDIAEPDGPGSLARCLLPLIVDPAMRTELGSFGRGFAEANFSLERMSEELLAVYRRSLDGHRRWPWFADLTTEFRPALKYIGRPLGIGKA